MSLGENPQFPAGVRLQRMAPRSRRLRNPPPEWEVYLADECIGTIEQWKIDSATATFYRATAFHPETGQPIPLESSTDLAERAEKVVNAWRDPTRFIRKASWE